MLAFYEDVSDVAIAVEEIAFRDDEVGPFAWLDAAGDAFESEDFRRRERQRAQRFIRAEPCFYRAAHALAQVGRTLEAVRRERDRHYRFHECGRVAAKLLRDG